MKRVLSLLVFVFSLMVLSAQDNAHNTPYNNYIDNTIAPEASVKEDVVKEDVEEEEVVSEEILLAQETVPFYQQSKQWAKYKKLKKCGWWLLGGGVGAILLGTRFLMNSVDGADSSSFGAGLLMTGGLLATVSSVPVLICAYHYRYKAKHLKVGVSAISTPTYRMDYSYAPALTLTYSF